MGTKPPNSASGNLYEGNSSSKGAVAPSGKALWARWPPELLRGSTNVPKLAGNEPKKVWAGWTGLGLSATGNLVGWGGLLNSGLWKLKNEEDWEPESCTTVFRTASNPRPGARPPCGCGCCWGWGWGGAATGLEPWSPTLLKLLKAVKGPRVNCCWGGLFWDPKMFWSWGWDWGWNLGGGGCWDRGLWFWVWGGMIATLLVGVWGANWSWGKSWACCGGGSRTGAGVLGNWGKFLKSEKNIHGSIALFDRKHISRRVLGVDLLLLLLCDS